MTGEATTRAGMVAVVGRANAGKSTLVNRFLGEKVSIVSPVAQTTRNVIRGILTDPRGQVVFLDTPGVHKAQSDLGRVMNKTARQATEGVDIVLLVVDESSAVQLEDDGWMRRLAREGAPLIVALNKHDLGRSHADEYRAAWQAIAAETLGDVPEPEWATISALDGEGVDALLNRLVERMPVGPLLFPDDILTDFPRKLTIADAIREQYCQVLKDELPHSVAVWIDEIEETDDAWVIEGVVYVQRESQKGIVLGAKGRMLRRVQRAARKQLSEMYDRQITLHLWVKVEKNWSKNYWLLKKFGYA